MVVVGWFVVFVGNMVSIDWVDRGRSTVDCCWLFGWLVCIGSLGTLLTFTSYDTYETNSKCWLGSWRLVDGWLLLGGCCRLVCSWLVCCWLLGVCLSQMEGICWLYVVIW